MVICIRYNERFLDSQLTELFNEVLDSATTLVENVGNANTTAEKGSAILNSVQGIITNYIDQYNCNT